MSHPVPARAAGSPVQSSDIQQYLTFIVAGSGHPGSGQTGEMFGFDIRHVKEIIEYGQVTQVPMMPRFVRGVINLRGNVVPVIDLAARFNRPLSAIHKRSCIVIVELQNEEGLQDVGVVVDSVCAVLEISNHQIEPPPSFGTSMRSDFIRGMGKVNERFVILLDMSKALSMEEIAQLADVGETSTAFASG